VFYLFRPRGGVNGIPLPCSAHYRLWIQPQSRRSAELRAVLKPQASGPHQPKTLSPIRPAKIRGKTEKEESPFVWAFLAQKGGIF